MIRKTNFSAPFSRAAAAALEGSPVSYNVFTPATPLHEFNGNIMWYSNTYVLWNIYSYVCATAIATLTFIGTHRLFMAESRPLLMSVFGESADEKFQIPHKMKTATKTNFMIADTQTCNNTVTRIFVVKLKRTSNR